ncbi:L-rhamnose mutarotase [Larkinella harenae]
MLYLLHTTKLLGAILLLATCQTDPLGKNSAQPLQRFGAVTGLHPEKVAYYKQLHADTWPGVLKKINECNIRNYSIYLHEIAGKPYLFSYYEYVGNNHQEDMKRIAADSVTLRWWRETAPCQVPLPEAAVQQKIWAEMEEVFHTD